MERKKLPVSEPSFEEIRRGNKYYYVDKTEFLYKLVEEPWPPRFLSRPRRFGKSLFLDTIRCLYEGKKELFEGLFIYNKWDWTQKHPVIKLDFSITEAKTHNSFKLATSMLLCSDQYPLSNVEIPPDIRLNYIINETYQRTNKRVVLLIDEYDHPIISTRQGTTTDYEDTKRDMRGILRCIKANRHVIEFVFMTGILKLSQHDFFSAANVFKDISLNPKFNEICGYTEEELLHTFQPELQKKEISKEISLDSLREWYDGYCWGGEKRLYNPNDVIITFDENRLGSWFTQYGISVASIEDIKKEKNFTFENYTDIITLDELWLGLSVEDSNFTKLLFQTGYLTIKSKVEDPYEKDLYILGVPNLEVKTALARLRLNVQYHYNRYKEKDFYDIRQTLRAHNPERLKIAIKSLFAKFGYNEKPKEMKEHHFSALMICIFCASGLQPPMTEVQTQEGRADMVVCEHGEYYIMEFKVLGLNNNRRGCAMKQIKEKNYASRYKEDGRVFLLGFEFTTSCCEAGDPPVTLAHLDWEEFPTRFTPTT